MADPRGGGRPGVQRVARLPHRGGDIGQSLDIGQVIDADASAAQGFSFRPPALGELVDADDVPIFANTFNPFHIRRGGFEQIAEVINAGDILLAAAAQLANRVCQIRRQVVVKQEVHAASRCSNSTAARTA